MTACFLIEPTGNSLYTRDWTCPNCGVCHDEGAVELHFPRPCPTCTSEEVESPRSSAKHEWIRRDTGEVHWDLREFGVGAMWNADWMNEAWSGPDGRCMVVICPGGGEWIIDSQANNCTRPGEDHDCWCRHGEPPAITVDKTPEPGRSTCGAGGGSIQTHNFHGFLRNGVFEGV